MEEDRVETKSFIEQIMPGLTHVSRMRYLRVGRGDLDEI